MLSGIWPATHTKDNASVADPPVERADSSPQRRISRRRKPYYRPVFTHWQPIQLRPRFLYLEATVRPVAANGAGVVNPAIPAAQAAAVGIGRGIDALTGRRSRVRRYIEQNAGQPGIAAPTAPSLRVQQQDADQAEAQRQADEQAQLERLNLRLAQRNAPPQPDSPQGRLEAATGLDRNGAARIIRMIENTELGQDPLMKRAIESYRRNVAFGGYVEQLTPLIRAIKSMQDSDPRIDALRVRDRDDQAADAQQQIDARIEQGKRDNQAFNDQLRNALDNDNNVDLQTKAVAQDALQKLRLDLGKTPVSHAQAILDDAIARARTRRSSNSTFGPISTASSSSNKQKSQTRSTKRSYAARQYV